MSAGSQNTGYMTRSRSAEQSANPLVEHDADNKQFVIKIGNDKAYLLYRRVDNVIHMDHTEVPDVFQGKGVGKILAKVKLDIQSIGVCMHIIFCFQLNLPILINFMFFLLLFVILVVCI